MSKKLNFLEYLVFLVFVCCWVGGVIPAAAQQSSSNEECYLSGGNLYCSEKRNSPLSSTSNPKPVVKRFIESRPRGEFERYALIVGNFAYGGQGNLYNPGNDAQLIAQKLRKLNYKVHLKLNVSKRLFEREIQELIDLLRKKPEDGSVVLIYFSGHGFHENNQNYLSMVQPKTDTKNYDSSVSVSSLIKSISGLKNTKIIVILDACQVDLGIDEEAGRKPGFVKMDAPPNIVISYSTSPGKVAFDSYLDDGVSSVYSPFASAFAEIVKEKVPVERFFKMVRAKVIKLTSGEQIPWEASTLIGEDFSLSR